MLDSTGICEKICCYTYYIIVIIIIIIIIVIIIHCLNRIQPLFPAKAAKAAALCQSFLSRLPSDQFLQEEDVWVLKA